MFYFFEERRQEYAKVIMASSMSMVEEDVMMAQMMMCQYKLSDEMFFKFGIEDDVFQPTFSKLMQLPEIQEYMMKNMQKMQE